MNLFQKNANFFYYLYKVDEINMLLSFALKHRAWTDFNFFPELKIKLLS